ncbi:hypothetical protein [Sphingobacterium cellulitidis]|uniref:Uncharacterized protein n=1 Tax=Sphingobacterium cellulitidis TaxID=1768011 RepID=A0A8H9KWN6_9SPHI|nr:MULTISPECIES: hypothetical protein [Sphingobacterium]MBA8984953.1 hypothetical protein [Sphingobacterium soli]OYD45031.1 hypothetical protein CHU00_13665 [Sphingobacterium cellulitidis]GGE13207.1 hypothetical protein GCM10011516_08750 [Sphingobacterium soli]
MIKITGLLICSILYFKSFNPIAVEEVRSNYSMLVSNRTLCERMIEELMESKNKSATHLGYLGGLQTIWANHVFSPISKLKTFREGKKNIEQAIKKEPNNVELRFIRLSVQKNAPFFLGYNSNINEDFAFIKANSPQITSEILLKMIGTLLKD